MVVVPGGVATLYFPFLCKTRTEIVATTTMKESDENTNMEVGLQVDVGLEIVSFCFAANPPRFGRVRRAHDDERR